MGMQRGSDCPILKEVNIPITFERRGSLIDDEDVFIVRIPTKLLARVRLFPMDRVVINAPAETVADSLVSLEQLVRRIEEQF